jgi:hypothetical protein
VFDKVLSKTCGHSGDEETKERGDYIKARLIMYTVHLISLVFIKMCHEWDM